MNDIDKDFWAESDTFNHAGIYRPTEELVFALIELDITYEDFLERGWNDRQPELVHAGE